MDRFRFSSVAYQANPDALIALIEAQMTQLSDSVTALRALRSQTHDASEQIVTQQPTNLRAFIVSFVTRAAGPVMNADIIANMPDNLIGKPNHTEVIVSQTLRRLEKAGVVRKLARGLWTSALTG